MFAEYGNSSTKRVTAGSGQSACPRQDIPNQADSHQRRVGISCAVFAGNDIAVELGTCHCLACVTARTRAEGLAPTHQQRQARGSGELRHPEQLSSAHCGNPNVSVSCNTELTTAEYKYCLAAQQVCEIYSVGQSNFDPSAPAAAVSSSSSGRMHQMATWIPAVQRQYHACRSRCQPLRLLLPCEFGAFCCCRGRRPRCLLQHQIADHLLQWASVLVMSERTLAQSLPTAQ